MLIILGKTASGKSTILDALVQKGYNTITTYTTRPRRKGESKESYHFISEEDFINKINDNFFAEWSSYDTDKGKWYYGSAREDYLKADDKTVVILNPSGYFAIRDSLDIPFKAIYLYANRKAIKERLMKRGDNKAEAERRLNSDYQDFKGLEYEVDRTIYNSDGYNIEDVIQNILDWVDLWDNSKSI